MSEIDAGIFANLKETSGADFINELVDTYLDDAPKQLAEMKSAQLTGDAESFRRAAHSLKSNSATFGAQHLADLSRELEMLGKENKLGDVGNRLQNLELVLQAVAAELRGMKA
jgi:histidine phosphotransfer protein HptB